KLTATTIKTEVRPVWVIKDSNNNFVHVNSIGMWDSKTWFYISHKAFTEECRAYATEERAGIVIEKLRLKSKSMGLEETFRLEYSDLNQLVQERSLFKGENTFFHEIEVA
ncbi:MAG TPA: hypothetical protein VIM42_05040, partial [Clostridium sp.]